MAAPVRLRLENWVKLEPGVPKTLHFADHAVVERVITDPILKRPKKVVSLVFLVDEEDGRPVEKSFSVVSERLMKEFEAYLPGKRYRYYVFTLLKPEHPFAPPRIVSVRPRGPGVR